MNLDLESKRCAEKEYLALSGPEAIGFDLGWDAAVAYHSEPAINRGIADEMIREENDALKKTLADERGYSHSLHWLIDKRVNCRLSSSGKWYCCIDERESLWVWPSRDTYQDAIREAMNGAPEKL
jgi:hypothetical protein